MTLTCSCKHEGQDNLHGPQKRVMNRTKDTVGTKKVYRCTVCTKEVQSNE